MAIDSGSLTLTVVGDVDRPLTLRYDELLRLPAIERRVLMDCMSGSRSSAVMKGVSIARLVAMSEARDTVSLAVFHCVDGHCERVPLVDLLYGEAFLAYSVKGERPAEPSWPPRLAIPGRFGYKWAKWVQRIELVSGGPGVYGEGHLAAPPRGARSASPSTPLSAA